MDNSNPKRQSLELWTNNEFSDFSIFQCTLESKGNNYKKDLIIATDLDAKFTNKIGEINSLDLDENKLQQYNWKNLFKEWLYNTNSVPNDKRIQALLEISNGRVIELHCKPTMKPPGPNKDNKNESKYEQQFKTTASIPSIKCRICNLSFTNVSSRRVHEKFHNSSG